MEGLPVSQNARSIFVTHFSELLNPEDFQRALVIFDDIGGYNEHGLAVQLHVAAKNDKLQEVLQAYEKLMAPDSYLHRVPDPVTRAVEVRLYKDVIYSSLIAGDVNSMLEASEKADIPHDTFSPMLAREDPTMN